MAWTATYDKLVEFRALARLHALVIRSDSCTFIGIEPPPSALPLHHLSSLVTHRRRVSCRCHALIGYNDSPTCHLLTNHTHLVERGERVWMARLLDGWDPGLLYL